jgi:hypothetical protein
MPPRPEDNKRPQAVARAATLAPSAALKDAPPISSKPSPLARPPLPAIADAMAQSLAKAEAGAGAGSEMPPPRLYDETDEQENTARLRHSSGPPRQEQTALLRSARPPAVATAPRGHEPIPFDRPLAPPPKALLAKQGEEPPQKILIMPLVVGFLIFALGLAFYIWAR